jgi:hypothetical protein
MARPGTTAGSARSAGRRVLEHRGELVRVHGVVVRLDVEQQRRRAGHLDRRDGGDGGVRDGGDGRALANAEAAQDQRQRVGAVGAAHRAAQAEPSGEFALEGLALLAEDVPAAGQRAGDGGIDLRLLRAVAGAGIGLRDRHDGRG